jgi:hypothetical protein
MRPQWLRAAIAPDYLTVHQDILSQRLELTREKRRAIVRGPEAYELLDAEQNLTVPARRTPDDVVGDEAVQGDGYAALKCVPRRHTPRSTPPDRLS